MSTRKALLLITLLLLPAATLFAVRPSNPPQDDVCAAVMDGIGGSIVWREAPGAVATRSTPRLIGSPAVPYPAVARQARVSGAVCLQVKIDDQGKVREVRAVCGPSLLQVFAEHAIRQWRYTPAISEGRPVEATGYVILNFQLDQ